mmetsp:Transcript_54202/g.89719  ORF Transcript_54202/g.89719 Transcript_54202/m.89719 type:complete len:470 (-) Transcript_54202:185-1594(-)|eukprot:CAMPEP_0202734016 /NCGR_PEP_ID=MMETSP1385-20130828/188459_1 /ASSEMBLY_ACC=CAM_ASM_000861 /TAXON_ID=933848 /ORGANISM="Elphidium margaritaceum" /LENGTH=469 /DNA_ID=CAMNT_0049400361 /DNA_START=43 /DNA_END=1452 /DNA_ORIENTATION=-
MSDKFSKDMEDEKQEAATQDKMTLILNTKLGQSKQEFLLSDLLCIDYFQSSLSGRWNKSDPIIIASKDLNFAVQELELVIFYKQNDCINRKYALNRLPFFCQALDYFTGEKLSADVCDRFFEQCVPAVTPAQLVSLKLSCASKECGVLLQAVHDQIKRFDDRSKRFHSKIFAKWETAPIKLLTSMDSVAAAVFIRAFYVDRPPPPPGGMNDDEYRNYNEMCEHYAEEEAYSRYMNGEDDDYEEMEECEDKKYSGQIYYTTLRNDLPALWACIFQRKLYKSQPQIFDRIFELEYYNGGEVNTLVREMGDTPTDISVNVAATLVRIAVDTTEALFAEHAYSENTWDTKDKFKQMIANFCELMVESSTAQHCVQLLVKSVGVKLVTLAKAGHDVDDAAIALFDCEYDWFGLVAKQEEKWITEQLPNHFPIEVVETVCETILDYILSDEYQANPCSPAYIQFIEKHKDIELNV